MNRVTKQLTQWSAGKLADYRLRLVSLSLAAFSSVFLIGSTAFTPAQTTGNIKDFLNSPTLTVYTAALETERKNLVHFYEQRQFVPVWLDNDGVKLDAKFLVQTLESSDSEGLDPADYFVNSIRARLNTNNAAKRAELDVLLTFAYVRYVTHVSNGRFFANELDDHNPMRNTVTDGFLVLNNALASKSVFAALYDQVPKHAQYQALRKKLQEYRKIAKNGGWMVLPTDQLLKPKTSDSRIVLLRQRLKVSGDLDANAPETTDYDDAVKQAVMHFQRRSGFFIDGVAGKETLEALNVSVEERIKQIIANMERWRVVPRNLGDDHILVNAAGFELIGVKNNKQALQMRVIVGQHDWSTPAMSTSLTQIVVNPDWRVPRKILVSEILPKMKKDPAYLTKNKFDLVRYTSNGMVKVDPSEVNWAKVNKGYFPYDLVRQPGAQNPLGKVKFVIPNVHDVYLHDTNNRKLFDNAYRDMSHGCVRLERPKDLAKFLLSSDSAWNNGKFDTLYQTDATTTVRLAESVPVHIVYMTAWVDEQGQVNFYNDIYRRDQGLQVALDL